MPKRIKYAKGPGCDAIANPMPDHKKLYGTGRWRRLRALWLFRHPFCVECKKQGYITLASDVDHIKPHRGNMNLFFSQDNWQSLCKVCHGIKSAGEKCKKTGGGSKVETESQ